MKENALVLFSGGQDSTTCLYWAREHFKNVKALSLYYGQKHGEIEVNAAIKIAEIAKVEHEILMLGNTILKGGSLLDGTPIPESLCDGIAPTFVPGRNLLFLLIAANRAYLLNIPNLVIGVSSIDFSGYPDCRASTILSMEKSLTFGFNKNFKIHMPLITLSKAETVLLAKTLPGCWEALSLTHTCYNGLYPPCGKCPACILRATGFNTAGYPDPLIERWANAKA